MNNDNHAHRLAEAEVIGASLALVKQAGWTIQKNAQAALSPAFWNYLYLPEAELLLVPTTDGRRGARFPVTRAVYEARSDALLIGVGKTPGGERQIYASVCMWSSVGVHWHGPHLPWLSEDDALWLVPDPYAPMDDEPSFCLAGGRLIPAGAPFANTPDRDRGLVAARAMVDQALEG